MSNYIDSQTSNQVRLTEYEIQMAAGVGTRRQIEALVHNRIDQLNNGSAGWNEHIEGAAAELATAKLFGVYWDGSVNTFKKADLSTKVQIRSTQLGDGKLIVRPRDPDDDIYVLVIGQIPTFKIMGGIPGSAAKSKEFLFNPQGRGTSKPAYFVPYHKLYLSIWDLQEFF